MKNEKVLTENVNTFFCFVFCSVLISGNSCHSGFVCGINNCIRNHSGDAFVKGWGDDIICRQIIVSDERGECV